MDRFDPFVKYADVYGDIINWEKDPMNKPQNQNKYFFSDGKTYYEQICKMLRLMSVFKEAFNQIYTNEDEISGAWENFVNNLSASVVEGSEPDVTLTWTDDSVNFEFTMVPGVPGEQGVGITSISFNSDYTMTITLSNGNTYTSMSLKGETGPQGPQGETGSGLQILDVYATLADLQSAHPTGQPGDAYQVGSAGSYTLYIWSSSQSAWVQAGTLGTVSPYTSAPLMDGTASAGSQNLYSRGDHRHPTDTSRASQDEFDDLIKDGVSLTDQQFTLRTSPSDISTIVKLDRIKGNTLVWNQLIPTNFLSTSTAGATITNNGDGSYTIDGTTNNNLFPTRNVTIVPQLGHKYYVRFRQSGGGTVRITINGTSTFLSSDGILDYTTASTNPFFLLYIPNGNTFSNDTIRPQIFDLTLMGLDVTANVFESLFPLPYYQFEQGRLLSFNGTGLKTTNADGTAEDTANLPTLTYFPNGMRSAGSAYDELTDSKAITRMGLLDLGSIQNWYQNTSENFWDTDVIPNLKSSTRNIICNKFIVNYTDRLAILVSGTSKVRIYYSGATTVEEVRTLMSGAYLCYELATPTETAIDLDMDFRAYENGTEQLLPVNGSVPSTSPIIADMTYLSIDDAMEYILDKLANVPLNTQQRLEALEDDVADLQTDVGTLQTNVSGLQTSVGNINTNIGQISSTVAGHTSSISDIQSDITDITSDVSDLETDVNTNTGMINQLTSSLASTDGQVQNLATSVSGLDSTVTAQGATVTALDSIIQDISNNPVSASLGQHELGLVAAYVDATLPANTGTMVTIPKPTIFPSNYTPLFIVGMSTGSYNVSICSIPWGFGNADSVTCRVWNHGGQQTTQITVYILCMRQRQSQ